MARRKRGAPTGLNIWVLAQTFGDQDEVANQLEATAVPHLRRCLKAGLVEAHGRTLRLTPAGRAAINEGG